jgi:hypothetical protein
MKGVFRCGFATPGCMRLGGDELLILPGNIFLFYIRYLTIDPLKHYQLSDVLSVAYLGAFAHALIMLILLFYF